MATRDFAPSHLERVLAIAESAYGTLVDPVAGSYIRNRQNFSIGVKAERRELNDKMDTASPTDVADGISRTEWAMAEMYLRPSGSLGTAPEPGSLLLAGLGASTAPNLSTTINSGATTTGGTLASGAGLAVGDLIRFGTSKKIVQLTAINTGTGVATWTPALDAAPATNEVVTCGVNYKLVADYERSLTFYRYMYHTNDIYPGCWVNQLGIKFGVGTELEFTASGGGCGKFGSIGSSAVTNNPLADNGTTLSVTTGEGRLFNLDDVDFYGLIESEVVAMTARSGDNITITRAQKSTSAAEHAQGTEVFPWVPSPTFVGGEIEGVTGFLYFNPADAVQRQFKLTSLEIQLTNGFDGRWATGSRFAYGIKRRDAKRAIQVNATGYYTRAEANLLRDAAKRGEKCGLVFWAGETSGSVIGGVLRGVIWDPGPIPEMPEGDDAMITLTGRAYASGFSNEDAFVIGAL